jgi:hypothetical protein
MFEHTSKHLSQQFRLPHSAPCYQGQLFDDLGFMGDTKCAQKILEGTYEYPPDTNEWTKKILQQAQMTFSQMSGIGIATMITTKDFQNYWQWVDERTLSSFSGITFSHYKVAAFHYALDNACGVSHSLRKERYTSEAVGSRTDGSSQKDHWK